VLLSHKSLVVARYWTHPPQTRRTTYLLPLAYHACDSNCWRSMHHMFSYMDPAWGEPITLKSQHGCTNRIDERVRPDDTRRVTMFNRNRLVEMLKFF